jgi:hypothetical protein
VEERSKERERERKKEKKRERQTKRQREKERVREKERESGRKKEKETTFSRTTFRNIVLSYELNAFNFGLDYNLYHDYGTTLNQGDLSKIVEKMEIFNPEKLTLNITKFLLGHLTLQTIYRLKSIKKLHLSFNKFDYEDYTAKRLFESLPNLKVLVVNLPINYRAKNVDVICNMSDHWLKIQKGELTIFFRKNGQLIIPTLIEPYLT